ncbi:MAG: hypothetical protein ACI9TK_000290 [Flavobacteriaceae bacterium]|jgi:hypothetical protein
MHIVICPAYLPNVPYFAWICAQKQVTFVTNTHYQKQTFRNRTSIYGANGRLNLTIPITHADKENIQEEAVTISYEMNWQNNHWKSICSAYKSSPYFEFYELDLAPFYKEKTSSLFDFNLSLIEKLMGLMELSFNFHKAPWNPELQERLDVLLQTKNIPPLTQEPYTQVFEEKAGFLPNLSILDVLFNLGPNCAYYLKNASTYN